MTKEKINLIELCRTLVNEGKPQEIVINAIADIYMKDKVKSETYSRKRAESIYAFIVDEKERPPKKKKESTDRSTLNKKRVRERIEELALIHRPGFQFTQVSSEVYDKLEQKLDDHIISMLISHPTKGHTFKP